VAKDTGDKPTKKGLDRSRIQQLAAEGRRAFAEDFVRLAAESDPYVPDLGEIIKLVGVPFGDAPLASDISRTWTQTRALRKVQKERAAHQTHALQVVRRCISLMRRLAAASPADESWADVTAEIAEFYGGFRHGLRQDVVNRRRLIASVEQAASMALEWRVFRAMARKRLGRATEADKRLLRRNLTAHREGALKVFGVEDLAQLSDARVEDFAEPRMEEDFFPERQWVFLVAREARSLLLPSVAAALEAHEAKLVALLRAWTERVTSRRGVADKWTLAAELLHLIGFAAVDPETLRRDVLEGNADRRERTSKHRSVGSKSP
jgi:hypothetical protein